MKIHLLAALGVAALAAPLAAQPPEGPPPGATEGRGGFMRMRLPATRAEAERMSAERFAERDANHDGFLSADELGERGGRMLERQDSNQDGKISAAEANAGALAMFDRADTDHNG